MFFGVGVVDFEYEAEHTEAVIKGFWVHSLEDHVKLTVVLNAVDRMLAPSVVMKTSGLVLLPFALAGSYVDVTDRVGCRMGLSIMRCGRRGRYFETVVVEAHLRHSEGIRKLDSDAQGRGLLGERVGFDVDWGLAFALESYEKVGGMRGFYREEIVGKGPIVA